VAFRFDSEWEVPTRNPTMAQLKSMRINRSWVFLYPGASKADPDGSIFGTKAIPFLYTGEDSVAAAIRDLAIDALNDGLTGDTYVDRALFADEKGMPLEASHMDDALRDAFIALRVAPEQSRKHSWHSYRVRLACKLRAAKKDDHTIQACVRWRSTKALDIYARFEPKFYWSLLMDTVQHDATSVEISTLPELDEGRRLIALRDSTLEQILRPSSPESSALHPESQAAAEIQRQRILGTGHPVGSSGAGSSTDSLPIPAPATGQLPVNAADKRIPPRAIRSLSKKLPPETIQSMWRQMEESFQACLRHGDTMRSYHPGPQLHSSNPQATSLERRQLGRRVPTVMRTICLPSTGLSLPKRTERRVDHERKALASRHGMVLHHVARRQFCLRLGDPRDMCPLLFPCSAVKRKGPLRP
jgi:hypothetical protein